MAILIGHASISESGTVTGVAGDSTGSEVCTREWYSKPWGFVAIHPDATVREKIATAVEQACVNDKIGYSQATRNTLHTYAKSANYDLSKITTACNCDCSSLINVAVVASGLGSYGSNGWTTSTMQAQLSALGFTIITTLLTSSAYCVRGAIYCKAGSHVVCGLSNGSSYATMLSKVGASTSSTSSSTLVKAVQTWLNDNYGTEIKSCSKCGSALLSVDGVYGTKTKSGLIVAYQKYCNKSLNASLTVDGIFGTKSKAYGNQMIVKDGTSGTPTYIVQGILTCLGYYSDSLDGISGTNTKTKTAIGNFQSASSLTKDYQFGQNCYYKALA